MTAAVAMPNTGELSEDANTSLTSTQGPTNQVPENAGQIIGIIFGSLAVGTILLVVVIFYSTKWCVKREIDKKGRRGHGGGGGHRRKRRGSHGWEFDMDDVTGDGDDGGGGYDGGDSGGGGDGGGGGGDCGGGGE